MDNRTVKEASVEGVQRRTQPKKHFMFCVKVSWSDGTVNLIYRRYSEFLHLQAILFQAFPGSLCRPGTKRKAITPLPDSFATRMNVGETVFTRMEQVNYFLKEVLSLASNVSQSQHIRRFLTPTQEDLEPRPPPRRVRFKKKTGRRRSSNFTQTVRRLQKFGKSRVFGNRISSPIVLEHFVVMDDYKKQAKSDISLKKGKTVDVIEKRECGWWLVESEGEVGWAPALYLEPADEMAGVSNVQTFSVGRGEIYVTSKRYVAVEDDELSFEIGVNLQILEKNYDGWWKASYLGTEGLVPAMYLKKLGNERAKTWRRKSRLFSSNELRDEIDEEDEVFQELPEEDNTENKQDKKASLPRKISHQVMSAFGKKTSKDAEDLRHNSKGADEDGSAEDVKSQGDHKSIDTMVEMSTVFLQLHKKDSNPIPGTPEKSQTLPVQRSPRLPQKSPRPILQRKAVSSVAAPTFGLQSSDEQLQEGSKDDLSLGNSRSRSLDSMPTFNLTQNAKYDYSLESKWKPEIKNALSSSLTRVTKSPESDQDAAENGKPDLRPQSAGKLNDLSIPDLNSVSEDEEDSAGLQTETNSSNDINSLDRRSDSTSSTELAQSPNVVMEEPFDLSRHFKTISLGGDSPRFDSPKRTPPVPTIKSLNALVDLRPRSPAPKRLPPVPGGISTFPRRANSEFEPHEDRRNPQSIDRKIIRQSSFERETAVELNEEIQCWSSSDESEPELTQLSFNQVVLHPESGHSPAIVVDEAEKTEKNGGEEEEEEEEEETGKEFNGKGPFEEEELDTYLNEEEDARLNDEGNFTESLKIQLKVPSKKDDDESTDIYCVFEDCEIDNEMYLSKGDYVKVLERASTGWWLVKNEEGLKGWTPSNFLCPAPQVKGNTECLVSTEEGKCSFEQQCDPQKSCRIIANYKGDPYNQELDLRKGEFAHVLHKSESGWWCLLDENGEIGWAPSNYLEVFEDEDDHEYIIQSEK